MNLPPNLPFDILGPVGRLLRGKTFFAWEPSRDGIVIHTMEGVEVEIGWRSDGAELKSYRLNRPVPSSPHILSGRLIDNVFTRDGLMVLLLADGHGIRFDWQGASNPHEVGIDCQIAIDPVSSLCGLGG